MMILDYVSQLERYENLLPRFEVYKEQIAKLHELPEGKYDLGDEEFFSIQSGMTRPVEGAQYEFHHKYIDLQIMLSGSEHVKWQTLDQLSQLEFDPSADIGFAAGEGSLIEIKTGMFYLVYPEDAHMPGLHVDQPNAFKKAVFKLKV